MAAIEGQLTIDAEDPYASWVRVDLDTGTVDTGSHERDTVLRSPEALDVENYPVTRFESTQIGGLASTPFAVSGDLYLKDVVGEVSLSAQAVRLQPGRVRFAATTTLSRRAFGLVWDRSIEKLGLIVGDSVRITVAAEFVA